MMLRTRGMYTCDHFISAAHLFSSLLASRCTFNFSLKDLLGVEKARRLRDELIAADRLKLAIDVATKCNISANKAWASWGLSLLRMGKLAEARDKFKYCFACKFNLFCHALLTPPCLNSTASVHRKSTTDDDYNQEELLQEIVETLEVEPIVNEPAVRAQLFQLHDELARKGTSNTRVLCK